MTNRRNCDDIYKLTCIKRFFFNTEMFNMQNIFQNELRSESLKKIGFFYLDTFSIIPTTIPLEKNGNRYILISIDKLLFVMLF